MIDLSFKGSAYILICLVNKVISAWFNLLVVLLRPPTTIKKLSSHICVEPPCSRTRSCRRTVFFREHKTNGHARLVVACNCMIAHLETEHIFIWQKLLLQKK